MDRTRRYPLLLAAGLLLCVSCTPKETKVLLEPSEALGAVLAEEVARVAGPKKQVAIISPDASWGAVSTAEEAFKESMKGRGFTVVTAKSANLGNPMRRGQLGLKAADFLEALGKSAEAGAIVSFAGAPVFGAGEADRVPGAHPPVLVVATASLGNVPGLWSDPVELGRLLDAKVIDVAVIDGGDPAAQPAGKPDAKHTLFAKNYRILSRPIEQPGVGEPDK